MSIKMNEGHYKYYRRYQTCVKYMVIVVLAENHRT